jgi:elongation factor Ts
MPAQGAVHSYSHGVRIGVLVDLSGGDETLGRDLAMHIAATNPVCLSEAQMPADLLAKEREIAEAQARESGKPDNIIEKMVEGRMRKFLAESTLVGQPFVKDPDTTVGKLLQARGATVNAFARFEVGEGIEKKVEDFREEVMAQAAAARGE